MPTNTLFQDLGNIEYSKAFTYQEKLFDEVLFVKQTNDKLPQCEQIEALNYLLFCEHPHVYTLGKSGDESNLLVDSIQLQAKNAQFFKTNRGGDITYHGPGQLVAYPILNLESFGMGIKSFVEALEEVVIQSIAQFGLKGSRLNGATGVWLDADTAGKQRKICAIGVRASHFVSMHGFAFNVNTDLNYFNYINPCGFTDKGVTSLSKELNQEIEIEKAKAIVKQQFISIFGMSL